VGEEEDCAEAAGLTAKGSSYGGGEKGRGAEERQGSDHEGGLRNKRKGHLYKKGKVQTLGYYTSQVACLGPTPSAASTLDHE